MVAPVKSTNVVEVVATSPAVRITRSATEIEGVAQVASPRQKVEAEAEVPLFRFVTGRLPDTSLAKLHWLVLHATFPSAPVKSPRVQLTYCGNSKRWSFRMR